MGGDFHLGHDRADASDEEVVGHGAGGGDDHREAGGGEGGLDFDQQAVGRSVDAAIAEGGREVEAGEDRAGQAEQRRDAADGRDGAQATFKDGEFQQGRFGRGGAHGVLAVAGAEQGGLDHARDRPR